MKTPFFYYSKSQRNGLFVLIVLVFVIQALIFWWPFPSAQYSEPQEVVSMQQQLDSLQNRSIQQQYKIYPFNPNYLSDAKAYQLGLSLQEIDRLFAFRAQGKFVNSKQEFKEVTQVSDSLLNQIAPYFKFPEWVLTQQKRKQHVEWHRKSVKIKAKDINKATVQDLMQIKGIGLARASRIVKYRKLLKGYTYDQQLDEVWGLSPEILNKLKKHYCVISKPKIEKLNINTASLSALKSIVYIDYKQAKRILEYRAEVAEIQNLAELKLITDFPVDKFDLISIYLQAE